MLTVRYNGNVPAIALAVNLRQDIFPLPVRTAIAPCQMALRSNLDANVPSHGIPL